MSEAGKTSDKREKNQKKDNIERFKRIKKKREQGVSMKYMAAAGADRKSVV